MKTKIIFHYFLTIFLLNSVEGAFQTPEILKRDGTTRNPGMQTCLRKKSLPILSELFGRLIDSEFGKIDPPDTTVKLSSKNQGTVITVRKIKFNSLTNSKKHSLKFAPPNQTEWTSSGLNFNVSGQFVSTLQQLFSSTQTSGSISLAARNATITVRTRIHATDDGKQRFEMISCRANFTNTSISTQASGLFGGLFKFFQTIIYAASTTLLEHITCNAARYYVETVLNDMFAHGIPTSISVFENQGSSLPSELIFNYGLLKDARVYKNCLAMREIGEVSWENKSGTPFHAPRLNFSTKLTNDHMLDIWLSDYVFNSLLYHGSNHRIFDVILDEKRTPQWASNLQSQCPSIALSAGVSNRTIDCISHALPELSNPNDFPSQTIEMQLKPSNATRAPIVLFRDEKPAFLVSDIIVDFFANDTKGNRKNILTLDGQLQSFLRNIKLNNQSLLSAEATQTNCSVDIKQDQLFLLRDLIATRATSMSLFVGNLLEKILNNKLSSGIPIAQPKGYRLIKSEIVLLNRTMNIASDVELNEIYWTNAASEARLRVQNKKP